MPRTSLDLPAVESITVLDADGHLDESLEPHIPPDDLRRLYRTFLLARRFDVACRRLGLCDEYVRLDTSKFQVPFRPMPTAQGSLF